MSWNLLQLISRHLEFCFLVTQYTRLNSEHTSETRAIKILQKFVLLLCSCKRWKKTKSKTRAFRSIICFHSWLQSRIDLLDIYYSLLSNSIYKSLVKEIWIGYWNWSITDVFPGDEKHTFWAYTQLKLIRNTTDFRLQPFSMVDRYWNLYQFLFFNLDTLNFV